MSAMEIEYEGRPVPWARPARGRRGGKTPEKQLFHRRALAKAMQFAKDRCAFDGPVSIRVVFCYRSNRTTIRIEDASSTLYGKASTKGFGKDQRPDVDNLLKQVMEAAELAGIVKDDVQFVKVEAVKVG